MGNIASVLIYLGFFGLIGLIGFAVWMTGSLWPLWALLIAPSIMTASSNNTDRDEEA